MRFWIIAVICSIVVAGFVIIVSQPEPETEQWAECPCWELTRKLFPLIVEYENGDAAENAEVYFDDDQPDNWDNWIVWGFDATDNSGKAKTIFPAENDTVFVVAVKDNLCGMGWVGRMGWSVWVEIENLDPLPRRTGYRILIIPWENVPRIILSDPIPWR